MIKRIGELTAEDKLRYLDSVKHEIEKTGISWDFYEEKIIEDINNTFDDERFCKMDPEFAIDAAYARKHFKWSEKRKKPELVDYLLWMGQFVTKTDFVEIL